MPRIYLFVAVHGSIYRFMRPLLRPHNGSPFSPTPCFFLVGSHFSVSALDNVTLTYVNLAENRIWKEKYDPK